MGLLKGILTLSILGTFLCLGQSNLSFKKVKLVGKSGSPESAELVFLSDQKLISIHGSHQTTISIPYNKVVRLSYWRAERSQTGKKVALGAVTYGLGALLVPKVAQYHFFIDYEEQGSARQVELLLGDSDWGQVLHTAHMETGKEVVTEGGATPASLAPATGQAPAAAGQAQAAAAPAPAAAPSIALPPPRSPAPAPPTRAALTITSTPPGADIQVNGAYSGNTPSTLKLDPGDYSIIVEKPGYASWQRSVTVTAPSAVALDAQLVASTSPSSATAPTPVQPQTAQAGPPPPVPARPAPAPAARESLPSAAPNPAESPTPYLHPVKLGSQWGYVDLQGQFRFAPQADSAELFSEGRALIALERHGTVSAPALRNGLPMLEKEYRYGWIDERGRTLIPMESTLGGPFSEGLALSGHATGSGRVSCNILILFFGAAGEGTCVPESRVDFIDKSGNVALHTDFVQGQKFSEKLAAVAAPGAKPADTRWGYIDPTGRLVIPADFLDAHSFSEGVAAVKVKGKQWGFIDHTGALVIQPEFQFVEDFSEGLAGVQYPLAKRSSGKVSHEAHPLDKRWGYIDRSGARVTPPSFVMAQPFFEGLAAVNTETMVVPEGGTPKNPHMVQHAQWSFADRTGRIVIPGPFQATARFSGGLAPVQKDGLWGYIDTTGAFRIPPQFQAARIFRGDRAAVQLGAKWGFIDRTGKFVVPPQFDDIK